MPEPRSPNTPDSPWRGVPILLATDEAAGAASAARVAAALAAERGAVPHAVRVFDVTPYGVPAPLPNVLAAADALVGPGVHAEDIGRVRAAVAAAVGAPVEWPVQVAVGTPSAAIARAAERVGAGLVVVGLRRHRLVDRAMGDETAVHVMRAARCPVLGVAADAEVALHGLPRRAVVGVDFGRTSARAAHAALSLLGPGGTLLLAYAAPAAGRGAGVPPAEADEGEALVHALGVDAAFERLVTELAAAAPTGEAVRVECVTVPSTPGRGVAEALLLLAEREGADLVAVAAQRHSRVVRLLLGSVTTELARAGRRSLLVVPPT